MNADYYRSRPADPTWSSRAPGAALALPGPLIADFSEMARTIIEFNRYVVAARDLRHQHRDAMTSAKQAAGDKEVSVHDAAVSQLALVAGVLDERELQRVRVLEGEHGVTHLRYRVRHGA